MREKNSRKKLTGLVCASGWIEFPFIEKEDSGENIKRGRGNFRCLMHIQTDVSTKPSVEGYSFRAWNRSPGDTRTHRKH